MPGITVPFTGWYESHRKFQVTFDHGINTIVGKNGSGKSSMINELKDYLRDNKIPAYHYDSVYEGKDTFGFAMLRGDITTAATHQCSSEGERVIVSYGNKLENIKQFLMKHKDDEYVFLLCDALDSGVSINVIKELMDVFELIIQEFPNVVIVNTANNYEFTRDTRCIIAKNGKDIQFKSYEDYVKFICKKR